MTFLIVIESKCTLSANVHTECETKQYYTELTILSIEPQMLGRCCTNAFVPQRESEERNRKLITIKTICNSDKPNKTPK